MPAKSSKQFRFFAANANDKSHSKKGIGGISKAEAKRMIKHTSKKKRTMFASRAG